jgi:hypothetical protein
MLQEFICIMLSLTIPVYEDAINKFVQDCILGFLTTHPLLGHMKYTGTVSEHRGPMRNVREPETVDHAPVQVSGILAISHDTLRNTDIDTYVAALHDLAQEYVRELSQEFFRVMSDVTNATGNVINAEGRPLSVDRILDALEMTDMTFDKHGQPVLSNKIIIGPQSAGLTLENMELTPEHTARLANILQQKKSEHDAKKRTRRLS